MRDYSPKRRTALVFTGSGSTRAYPAGVLRALDESGVKIDLVVGSRIGAVSAAYAALGGGPRPYAEGRARGGAGWGPPPACPSWPGGRGAPPPAGACRSSSA